MRADEGRSRQAVQAKRESPGEARLPFGITAASRRPSLFHKSFHKSLHRSLRQSPDGSRSLHSAPSELPPEVPQELLRSSLHKTYGFDWDSIWKESPFQKSETSMGMRGTGVEKHRKSLFSKARRRWLSERRSSKNAQLSIFPFFFLFGA